MRIPYLAELALDQAQETVAIREFCHRDTVINYLLLSINHVYCSLQRETINYNFVKTNLAVLPKTEFTKNSNKRTDNTGKKFWFVTIVFCFYFIQIFENIYNLINLS